MTAQAVLARLNLTGLYTLIKDDLLEEAVARAYADLDSLNSRLDAFEEAFPGIAEQLPWHQARQRWKANGRPKPPWYEALRYHSHSKDWKPPWPYVCEVPWMGRWHTGRAPLWVLMDDPTYKNR